ncbi:hypothetical protein ABQX22_00525 [Xanthomonas sp. WHRI 1810A]|uniref:hypothetical protein n=1 Tax=Xanthomonas sp. WHRI 1810A TaxID=3161565 RepID=UPI0032E87F25
MTQLNGWWRVWIIGCVLLGAAMVPLNQDSFPSEAKLDKAYQYDVEGYKRLIGYKKNPASMPSGFDIGEWKYLSADEIYTASVKAGQRYEADLEGLKYVQAKFVGSMTLYWGMYCIALLLVGYIGAWVVKGFRLKRLSA